MLAMNEYKQKSGRMFPTWSEVLEVLRGLGYEKVAAGPLDVDTERASFASGESRGALDHARAVRARRTDRASAAAAAPARLTPGAKQPIVAIDEHTNPLRPQSDRLLAHRRRAHGPVQLAAGPASRRPVHPADRRHRPGAARRPTPSSASSTAFAGSASTGTKGPKVGGPFGPYFQSQRHDLYRRAAEQLVAAGHVYRDYSTEAERAADKAAAERDKRAYRFRRKPMSRPRAERLSRPKAGRSPCGSRSPRAAPWSSTT